jgi:acyl carrier protein
VVVANVWQEVLGIPKIDIYANFYDLGGNSILIIEIISRLNRIFQIDLPLLSLVESPTISELAQCIEAVYRAERYTRRGVRA